MMVQEKLYRRDVTVRRFMETVVKDRPCHRRSGGLTLSGGESLSSGSLQQLLRA